MFIFKNNVTKLYFKLDSVPKPFGISAFLCDGHGYVWVFPEQKHPGITDAELVTSLTLQDEETLGSNTISLPLSSSQESVR